MRKGYTYIVEKDNERYEYDKLEQVANLIGCVPSTVFIYAKSNKIYKGWKITIRETENTSSQPRKYKVEYNPRKKHKGKNNWNYTKYSFLGNEIICCEKTFFIDGGNNFILEDFLKIKELLIKGISQVLKGYIHSNYIRIPEITLTKRINKIVEKRIINIQVYVGRKGEGYKLIDQVNEIENKILFLDKIIEEYENRKRNRDNTD